MNEQENEFLTACLYEDDKGHRKLIADDAAQYLCKKEGFVTIKEIGQMLHYDGKRWADDAEEYIKQYVEVNAHKFATRGLVSEIIEHIRRANYENTNWTGIGGINVDNGIYDTETGLLEPHSQNHPFRYVLPVAYNPEASCPIFLKFLHEITGGDFQMQISILESMAYCLMPEYPIQRAIMLVGSGSNGKSSLLRVLTALLGDENVSQITIQSLTNNRFSTEWLTGRLANIAPDLPKKGLYDTGTFKALTGGDPILAEIKRIQKPVRLRNCAKMLFSCNEIPDTPDDTDAFYRRWLILEFKQRFSEGRDIVPELTTAQELAGIFNLLVRNILPILQKTLKFTFAPDYETGRATYVRRSNTVKAFAEEHISYDPAADVPKAAIYGAYKAYCEKENLIVKAEVAFWRSLKQIVSYEEHRPERGGVAWIRGQRIDYTDMHKDNKDISLTEINSKKYHSIRNILYNPVQPCANSIDSNKVLENPKQFEPNMPNQVKLPETRSILERPVVDDPILTYLRSHGGKATREEFNRDLGLSAWDDLPKLEGLGEIFKPRVGIVKLVHFEEFLMSGSHYRPHWKRKPKKMQFGEAYIDQYGRKRVIRRVLHYAIP